MTASRVYLSLALLVPRVIEFSDSGKPLMELLHTLLPEYAPLRYGTYEPLKERMEAFDVQRLEEPWQWGFYWKGRPGVVDGGVDPRCVYGHSSLRLTGKAGPTVAARAAEFILQASRLLRPDFAYVHQWTATEWERRDYHQCHPYHLGIVTHELRKYLPDLVWGTVFGPPYVCMFGRDALLTAPVHAAREVGEQAIYLQLTESLTDLQTDYDRVDSVREATKDHLGRDAFLDMAHGLMQIYNPPPSGRYRTPTFTINP